MHKLTHRFTHKCTVKNKNKIFSKHKTVIATNAQETEAGKSLCHLGHSWLQRERPCLKQQQKSMNQKKAEHYSNTGRKKKCWGTLQSNHPPGMAPSVGKHLVHRKELWECKTLLERPCEKVYQGLGPKHIAQRSAHCWQARMSLWKRITHCFEHE